MAWVDNLSAEERAALTHWSSYGQRGRTPDHRVVPWEWRNEPFQTPVTSPWRVKIEPHQLPLLLLGFAPRISQGYEPCLHLFTVGAEIMTHIFMSASKRTDVSASEDKWFVYADGPDHDGEVRLHMYRSWTGIKQVELVIDAGFDGYGKTGEGASISSIIWESDPDQKWKDGDMGVYKDVAREVCSWVLDVHLGPEDG